MLHKSRPRQVSCRRKRRQRHGDLHRFSPPIRATRLKAPSNLLATKVATTVTVVAIAAGMVAAMAVDTVVVMAAAMEAVMAAVGSSVGYLIEPAG
jgi:hypothetical protein